MLKPALLLLGVVVAIVLAVVLVGYALPQSHVASSGAVFSAPPATIFSTLQDVDRYPSWRSDVQTIDVIARSPHLRWREQGSNGTITFEMQEVRSPSRLMTRITDRSLPFGGTWTYEVSPHEAGARLTITENGEVYNPVFRFMSRFVFGHTATMDTFLADLRAHLQKDGRKP